MLHVTVTRGGNRALLTVNVSDKLLQVSKREKLLRSVPFKEIASVTTVTSDPLAFVIQTKDRVSDTYVAVSKEDRDKLLIILRQASETGAVDPSLIEDESSHEVLRSGWVEKKGTFKYSKRWLALTNGSLMCFKDEARDQPLNCLPIFGMRISCERSTITVHTKERPFAFRVKNEGELEAWMSALARAQQLSIDAHQTATEANPSMATASFRAAVDNAHDYSDVDLREFIGSTGSGVGGGGGGGSGSGGGGGGGVSGGGAGSSGGSATHSGSGSGAAGGGGVAMASSSMGRTRTHTLSAVASDGNGLEPLAEADSEAILTPEFKLCMTGFGLVHGSVTVETRQIDLDAASQLEQCRVEALQKLGEVSKVLLQAGAAASDDAASPFVDTSFAISSSGVEFVLGGARVVPMSSLQRVSVVTLSDSRTQAVELELEADGAVDVLRLRLGDFAATARLARLLRRVWMSQAAARMDELARVAVRSRRAQRAVTLVHRKSVRVSERMMQGADPFAAF